MLHITRSGDRSDTRVSFVTDGGCLACCYELTYKLRTWTDTRQLESLVPRGYSSCPITTEQQRDSRAGEIIPEVGGGGDWALGVSGEKGPQVSRRAQNHLYNYFNC